MTGAPRPVDARSGDVEQAVLRRVEERADEWFPGAGSRPDLQLERLVERPRAALYAVRIGGGVGSPQVLAKVRRGWGADDVGGTFAGDRPRLVPTYLPTSESVALEYAGLQAIHALVGDAHPAFGAVRPLDHLADHGTILMDYVDGTTLRQLIMGASRLPTARPPAPRGDSEDVWRAAGSWLRFFQTGVPAESLPSRQATRDEVLERFHAYDEFLTTTLGRRATGHAALRGAGAAAQLLPEHLPLVVGHGDFAPRNVFQLRDGRLAVFDPMPRWAVPPLEDLARFLVAIRLLGVQVHSHGAAFARSELRRREEAVIDGYRDSGSPDLRELRCYQLLITLDTWSGLVGGPVGGWRSRVRRVSARSASGYLRAETRRLLELIESGPSS